MTIPQNAPYTSVSATAAETTTHAQAIDRLLGRRNEEELLPITIDDLILRCEMTMKGLDEQLRGKLSGQDSRNAKLKDLADVSRKIGELGQAPVDPLQLQEWQNNKNAIFDEAKQKNPELSATLDAAKNAVNGLDNLQKKSLEVVNNEMDALRSDNETAMIAIQSIISKRSQALQMTSNIVNSFNEASKGVIQNIR